MKYIFFILISMSTVHAMEKKLNETGTLKVLGLVEIFHSNGINTYKAFLNNGCVVWANLLQNGDIRVTCESSVQNGKVKEIKTEVLEDSRYHELKDLHEKQYGLK